jgi:hypothetical protein
MMLRIIIYALLESNNFRFWILDWKAQRSIGLVVTKGLLIGEMRKSLKMGSREGAKAQRSEATKRDG